MTEEKVEAVLVDSVYGAKATADGAHVLLRLNASELPHPLAFTVAEVPRLIDAVCASLDEAMKTQGGETKYVSQATWFELGRGPKGEAVLSITFGAGGTLSFELPEGMSQNMYEVLGTFLGHAIPPKPETPLN